MKLELRNFLDTLDANKLYLSKCEIIYLQYQLFFYFCLAPDEVGRSELLKDKSESGDRGNIIVACLTILFHNYVQVFERFLPVPLSQAHA